MGSCRDIVLSAKNRANEWQPRLNVKSQELEDGSLFVMKPGCQTYFLHRINEGDKYNDLGPRISISIRRINDEALIDMDSSNDLFSDDTSDKTSDTGNNAPRQYNRSKTTVILGDSIDAELVPTRLQKGNTTVLNLSKGGNKIKDISSTIDSIPSQGIHFIDQAIISVGINDIQSCRGRVQHFKDAYVNLIHKLKLMFPSIKIYVRCVLPVKIVNQFTVINITKFNKLLLHICKVEHCHFINIFRDFLNPDGQFRNLSLYRNDIHLRQRGTGIIARKYIFIVNKNTFNPYIS